MPPRVCVVGSINVDVVTRVARHPRPGETVQGSALSRRPGGKGANQALAASQAGAITQLVGRVGDDTAGAAYLNALTARGVDCSAVTIAPNTPTGHAIVTVDEHGENTVVVVAGANTTLTVGDVERAATLIEAADVVLLQLELPPTVVLYTARFAAVRGKRVVVNLSPFTEVDHDLLTLADPVIVNEHEARVLTCAIPSLCVTRGAQGAEWGETTVAAPRVDVVDTTGAGDAFAGALATALAAGVDRRPVLEQAVAAGAAACLHLGAQDWTF